MRSLRIAISVFMFAFGFIGVLMACAVAGIAARLGSGDATFLYLIGVGAYIVISAVMFLWLARGALNNEKD